MEIDDAFSASLIDSLIIFCKSRLRDIQVLEILDNQDVKNFLESIRQDNTEFIEEANVSAVWSAIVRGFEESPILNISRTNSTADEIVSQLNDASKRAYGAFLSTSELIVEVAPRCAPTIVQSLYKVFVSPILIGHSNSTTFIFSLLQDYKMYFPYTYTFCRRIGRSPTTTLQQWREYFYPRHQSTDEVQTLSQNWDMSGLEEGEDSDGEDQKSIPGPPISVMKSPAVIKKRNTRMSTTRQRKGPKLHSNSLSADLLVEMQSSGEDNVLEIQDMSFDTPKSNRNQNSLSLQSASDKKSRKEFDSPARTEKKKVNPPPESVTIEDLRKAFSQSLEDDDSDLAEKGKLSSVLKFRYSLPTLALKIQAFHDFDISWDELKELASPYLIQSTLIRTPDSPKNKKKLIIPTPIPSVKADNDPWQDRVFHNYLVDSSDQYSLNRAQIDQPSSPYLSLPKAPPPAMSSQQIAEYLFHEADRKGTGTASHVDLISTIQLHPELSEQLQLSHHDETLNLFIQKARTRGTPLSLTDFLQLIRETSEERRHQQLPLQVETRWQSNHSDQANHRGLWDSHELPLNPNRISTKSDDILLSGRDEFHRNLGSSHDLGHSNESQPRPLATSPTVPLSSGSPNLLRHSAGERIQQSNNLEYQRPPLHKSISDLPREIHKQDGNSASGSEKRFPAPPSELGTLMRIILEGWLEKKSSKLGIWQKRYFVLAFGTSVIQHPNVPCIQLQIFKRATESAWGMIPLGLSRIVDVESLSQLLVVSNKKKIDTVFTLTEKIKSAEGVKRHVQDDQLQDQKPPDGDNIPTLVRRDSNESIASDDIWTGKSRITTLKAADPEERLLWVNTIRRSMEICQSVGN